MARTRKSSDKRPPGTPEIPEKDTIEDAIVLGEAGPVDPDAPPPEDRPVVVEETAPDASAEIDGADDVAPARADAEREFDGTTGGTDRERASRRRSGAHRAAGGARARGRRTSTSSRLGRPCPDRGASAPPPPPPARSGGSIAVPLFFGGVIAALAGFAVSRFVFPDGWPGQGDTQAVLADLRTAADAQTARIAELESALAALRDDVGAVPDPTAAIQSVREELGAQIADAATAASQATDRLGALTARVEELAQRPSPAGLDPASLDAELAQFRADLSAAVDEARANVVTAQEEAAAIARQAAEEAAAREAAAAEEAEATRAAAQAAAEAAARQAALTSILAALDSGAPFADQLAGLAGADVPAALSAPAADGVPTLTELVDSFPEAARAALDASIRAGVGRRRARPVHGLPAGADRRPVARTAGGGRPGRHSLPRRGRAACGRPAGAHWPNSRPCPRPDRPRWRVGPNRPARGSRRWRPRKASRRIKDAPMLWSLIKFLVFIGIVAALSLGAMYLIDTGAGVRIAIANMEFTLGPVQAVIAAVVLLLFVWLVLRLAGFLVAVLRFLNGDETAISRWFDRNRERKGYEALADGLMALASGEARVAMSKAAKAERYLGRPDLTNLVTAQAAEMSGDRKKAEEVYKRLLADDRTRFVGVRGIMKQKIADGDTAMALKLAEKAFALKPRHEETQDVLLRLQAEQRRLEGRAQDPVDQAQVRRAPAARAQAARCRAGAGRGEGHPRTRTNSIEAREAAIEANRLSPDLIPAAAMAARAYVARDQQRYATRVLKKAWGASPHPDLADRLRRDRAGRDAEAAAEAFRGSDEAEPDPSRDAASPGRAERRGRGFRGGAAARWATCPRRCPTPGSLALLAAIERGEGASDATVRRLLTRALSAPRGPQWVCDNCHNVAGDWEPVCSNCGAFDTLSWREPPAGAAAPLTGPGGEVLPMIAGKSDPDPEPEPAAEPVEVDIDPADVNANAPPDEVGFVADEAKK